MPSVCFVCRDGGGSSRANAIEFVRYLEARSIGDVEVSYAGARHYYPQHGAFLRTVELSPTRSAEQTGQMTDVRLDSDVDLVVPAYVDVPARLARCGCTIPMTEDFLAMTEKNEHDLERALEVIYNKLINLTQAESAAEA